MRPRNSPLNGTFATHEQRQKGGQFRFRTRSLPGSNLLNRKQVGVPRAPANHLRFLSRLLARSLASFDPGDHIFSKNCLKFARSLLVTLTFGQLKRRPGADDDEDDEDDGQKAVHEIGRQFRALVVKSWPTHFEPRSLDTLPAGQRRNLGDNLHANCLHTPTRKSVLVMPQINCECRS